MRNNVLMGVAGALGGTVVVLGAILVAQAHRPTPSAPPVTEAVAPPIQEVPSAPPPMTPAERIAAAQSFRSALSVALPEMSDETDTESAGAALLTVWGMRSMSWADVGVATDETTFALTQKDSDEARGKRLCASGTIVEITLDKTLAGKFYDGLLMTGGGNLFRFFAVGSTGALVAQSWARVCGVVVGKYDYSNSGGGTGHAVALVGMFDLPENRARKVSQEKQP